MADACIPSDFRAFKFWLYLEWAKTEPVSVFSSKAYCARSPPANNPIPGKNTFIEAANRDFRRMQGKVWAVYMNEWVHHFFMDETVNEDN